MLCGCIGEKSINACIKIIKKAQKQGADLVELRLDYLEEKDNLEEIISASNLPIIATNRGGNQKILINAIISGAKYIDMDIGEIDKEVLNFAKKKQCKIILSYHNFKTTPSFEKLFEISKTLFKKGANIVKIITTSKSQNDNKIILSLYSKIDFPLIAFSMGEVGKQTRLDCLAYGALWTYCSVNNNKTAPGQISLSEAKKTKLYCVIGNPIKHSLSPAMHNANFKSLGMNAEYISVEVKNLKNYMKNFALREISGINITIPHKVEIMKYLDKIDPLAEKIHAVNTIAIKNKKLIGYNTDGYGALLSIKEKVNSIKGKKIIILGSGGAARAIYFTLKQEKAEVVILARDKKKAQTIGKSLQLNNKNLKTQLKDADILINSTSVGMKTNKSIVPKKYLKKNLIVFDIVYNPFKTKLIKDAESIGCKTILGYKMLVYQGAKSFEIWTKKKPNISLMMNAVRNELMPNIALIGFMGVGKTSVGKKLAKKLNKNFVDLDEKIEQENKLSIKQIFEKYRELHFRELEKKMLQNILKKKNQIISCGGGIVLDKENRNLLKSSIVVLLKAKPRTIFSRIKNSKNRPLINLGEKERQKKIKQMLRGREKIYNFVADYSINTDNKNQKEIAEDISRILVDYTLSYKK